MRRVTASEHRFRTSRTRPDRLPQPDDLKTLLVAWIILGPALLGYAAYGWAVPHPGTRRGGRRAGRVRGLRRAGAGALGLAVALRPLLLPAPVKAVTVGAVGVVASFTLGWLPGQPHTSGPDPVSLSCTDLRSQEWI